MNLIFLSVDAQLPTNGLISWYSGDDVTLTSGFVSQWNDQSGNGFHLIQNNAASRPSQVTNFIAGHSVVRFDGTNDYLKVDFGQSVSQPITIFLVWKINTQKAQYLLDGINASGLEFNYPYNALVILRMYAGAAGGYSITYEKPLSSNLTISTLCFNSTSKLYDNSVLKGSYNIGSNGLTGLTVGAAYYLSTNFQGDIAELIVYNTSFNDAERLSIENYLMNKYSPSLNLGPDITYSYGFCPTTLSIDPSFTNILWSTGETSNTITINKTGKYFVQATDIYNRIKYDTITINYPAINLKDTTICLGDSVLFSGGLNGPYSYLWSNSSSLSTAYFSQQNTYWLQITDTNGCIIKKYFNIVVDSFPSRISLGNDTSLCSGNTIRLVAGENLCNSFQWFPSGSTAPFDLVTQTGWKKLKVQNQSGCTAVDSIFITIKGTAPTPDFQIQNLCFGQQTQFLDLSYPHDSIANWTWIINSEDTLNVQNPVYIFNNHGLQNVELIINSYQGCSNDTIFSFYIFENPKISFNVLPGCTGTPVQFNSNIEIPQGTSIQSIAWFINNNEVANTNSFENTFTESGEYTIRLEVILNNSCKSEYIKNVTINSSYPFPDVPRLIFPDNDIFYPNGSITFQWNETENAVFYELLVAYDSLFNNLIFSNNQITSLNYSVNLTPVSDTLYWVVKSYNPCLEYNQSSIRKFILMSPQTIGNLQLWLNADSVSLTSSNISQIYDLSGNGFHFQQNNQVSQPQKVNNIYAGKPAIRFDGVNDYIKNNFGQSIQQPITIFLVWKANTQKAQYLFDGINSGSLEFNYPYNALTLLRMYAGAAGGYSITYDKPLSSYLTINSLVFDNPSYLYEYGQIKGSYNIGSNPISGLTLGSLFSTDQRFFSGDITEVILYNASLNNNDRKSIEKYLHDKYMPPVNLGRDIKVNYGWRVIPINWAKKAWFTNYQWSNGSNDSVINVNKSGIYSVTVTDISGVQSKSEIRIIYPVIHSLHDTTICFGDTLFWDPEIRGAYAFEWNNGQTTPIGAFTQPGSYFVRITDTLGNTAVSDTLHLNVDMYPLTASLGPDSSMCAGNRLRLLSGAAETATYLWNDGSVLPYLKVINPGTYSVTVTNNRGCTAVDSVNITIQGIAPIAEFIADTVCFKQPTHFTNLSQSPDGSAIIQYNWNFGVSGGSTLSQPVFTYPGPGEFEVTLRILTQNNCAEEIMHNVRVYDNPHPKFLPQQGCSGTNIQFTSQSVSNDGLISRLTWIFNDTIFFSSNQAVFYYSQPGNYPITLIAQSEYGCSDTLNKLINIRPGPAIGFDNSPMCIGEEVYFNGYAQTFLNTRAEYYWYINQNLASSVSNPIFVFDSTGVYNIKLMVKQPINNCTSELEKNLSVYNKPVAGIDINQACQKETVIITDTCAAAESPISSYYYYIQGKGSFYSRNPSVVFNDTGRFGITLMITDAAGCSDTSYNEIVIHPKPKPLFEFSPRLGVIPQQVQFQNNSLYTQNVNWNFGDGFVSSIYNPTHTYTDSGFYRIRLTAFSEFGCVDTISSTIKILLPVLDIEVRRVDVRFIGMYMEVSATLANFGTVEVNVMDMEMQTSDGKLLKETWRGSFRSGGSFIYTFSTHLAYSELTRPEFVCVTAIPYTLHDEVNPDNNMSCKTFSSGFTMYNIYPNPSDGDIIIEFNLPVETDVRIDFVNYMGKSVYGFSTPMLHKGFNRIIFDARQLGLGLFICRISYKDVQVTKRFWITYGVK